MSKKSRSKARRTKTPIKSIAPADSRFKNPWWGWLLLLAVILTYQPLWHAGFIWDDDMHVTANPVIIGPLGLREIWTTSAAQYYPLVLTTFWVEHALWGLQPLPYHLVNVLMHGECAILLWRVLENLRVPGAWLGAAVWALHPVQVETVTWISELKNTQSGLFYLLAILFFIRGTRTPEHRLRHDATAWLFAALALASKSSTVVLPVELCLCAWWMEGKWHWRNLARVTPIALMSIGASVLAMWTVKLQGVNPSEQTWPERLITAGHVVWFYLGKLAWPHPLIFIYPRWNIAAGQWLDYLLLPTMLILLGVLWFKRNSGTKPEFFALAYFLAALLPVLGLVNHYFLRYSFVADHLQYLASMGPLVLVGSGVSLFLNRAFPEKPWWRFVPAAGLLSILALLSWERSWAYEDSETLWTDTLIKNPGCWMAENNLGNLDFRKGRVDEAVVHYEKALESTPNSAEVHDNLGVALSKKGQTPEATTHFEKALEIDPGLASAHDHLGNLLFQEGQVDEAIGHFREAAQINPYSVAPEYNLGNALLQEGRVNEAITQYRKVLQIDPRFAEAYSNLGLALGQVGQWDESIAELQKALALNPDYAQAHNNLGMSLAQSGRIAEALTQFQEAVRLNPDYPAARENVAKALSLLNQGR